MAKQVKTKAKAKAKPDVKKLTGQMSMMSMQHDGRVRFGITNVVGEAMALTEMYRLDLTMDGMPDAFDPQVHELIGKITIEVAKVRK